MTPHYRMIVLDLDGTLLNDEKQMTAPTREALIRARERGAQIVLASGRPTRGIMPLAHELGIDTAGGYILAFNGALITRIPDGQVLYSKLIQPDICPLLARLALDNQTILMTYDASAGSILANAPAGASPYLDRVSRNNRMAIQQCDMGRDISHPCAKFLMLGEPETIARCEGIVKAAVGDRLNVYRSESWILEMVAPGIDKGVSLARLLEALHIDRSQMIAVGDGWNDRSMIEFAGLGVAMANAVPPVKEAADYITASNNEDGVARVVQKFLL